LHKQNLTEEQKAKIKAIRAIKNKQSSGQSLTAEEQKLLQEHEAKKAQRKSERTNKKTDTSTKQ
jgi:LTXXQ motif